MTGDGAAARLDNIAIVVDDLEKAKAFFGALGMELEGEATVGGGEVDRLLGLDGVRTALAMMRTADGHGRIELTEYLSLPAAGDGSTPVHALGGHRVMFAVDDVDAALDRLRPHGAELIGDVVRYETHQLAYVRGPAGITVALAAVVE